MKQILSSCFDLHIGFRQSLCLNLRFRRWLKPSRNLVINFTPSESGQLKKELALGRMNFITLLLKTLRLSGLQISESSTFHSFIVVGKKTFFGIFMIRFYMRNVYWVPHCIPCVLLGCKSEKVILGLLLRYFKKTTKFPIPTSQLQRFKA